MAMVLYLQIRRRCARLHLNDLKPPSSSMARFTSTSLAGVAYSQHKSESTINDEGKEENKKRKGETKSGSRKVERRRGRERDRQKV